MANTSSPGKPESIAARALRLIARRYKIKQPMLLDRAEARLRSTNKPIYQFRAAAEKDPNGPQFSVVLDEDGKEVDLDEARERDGTDYFARPALSVDVGKLKRVAPAASVQINPSTNDLVLNQGDTLTEKIVVTVPANASVPKADVYFLTDSTGSMTDAIGAVKSGSANILAALNGLGLDLAFGVGNYKDFPSDPYAFDHQLSLTQVVPDVQTAINAWNAQGGSDLPEGQLFALDELAVPPGGSIGWRAGAKRIIVWFGDAPGHDPVCAAISGKSLAITEGSVTTKLVNEQITVLAISTASPGLDADPTSGAVDYLTDCGAPGGTPGQGTKIATATGGQFVTVIDPTQIVQTIIDLVTAAVGSINNLNLVPSGATAPFVTSITPPGGYGPLAGDEEHVLEFEVTFTGLVPCKDEDQFFSGSIDVVADGVVVAKKSVRIKVPACERAFSYSVKFLCGVAKNAGCDCAPLRPGHYATEINIYNFQAREITIRKRFVPVILSGAVTGPRAEETLVLPPRSATMDDCCRMAEMLFGGTPPSALPLTVGFLEIVSPSELSVTAVYTVSDGPAGRVSIDVEQVEGRATRTSKSSSSQNETEHRHES
jgi:hypothetical protein